MTYLPDVNVWIALAADKHIHHIAARSWFAKIGDEQLAFCRINQLAFLRLLTNKHVMQEDVMSPSGAWNAYQALRSDWRIGYLREPEALSERWNAFTHGA